MSHFNWVDYSVLGVFFFSVLAGLSRGLIKEVLGLISWIVALIVACMFSGRLASAFTGSAHVQSAISTTSTTMAQPISLVAIGVSFVGIFGIVLLLGKIIASLVSGVVEGGGMSIVNRALGGLFGLGRGFLLVILFLFLVGLTPFSAEPWWTQSVFVNLFNPVVQSIDNAVQPGLENLKATMKQQLQNINQNYIQGVGSKVYQSYQGLSK